MENWEVFNKCAEALNDAINKMNLLYEVKALTIDPEGLQFKELIDHLKGAQILNEEISEGFREIKEELIKNNDGLG